MGTILLVLAEGHKAVSLFMLVLHAMDDCLSSVLLLSIQELTGRAQV